MELLELSLLKFLVVTQLANSLYFYIHLSNKALIRNSSDALLLMEIL